MRLTYDPRHNIAYIRFGKKQGDVETIKVSEELCIDMSPDGKVYGIELLNANEQLRREESGKLLVKNEATRGRIGNSAKECSLNNLPIRSYTVCNSVL